ncbi:MAG: ral bacterial porin, family [Paraburkholderia sp.]|nr:ral bacterial porin, family [Paraburkholderia sp.]
MKKKVIGAAALAVFAVAAHAQSSVTLYGLIDTGIVYSNSQSTSGVPGTGHSAWQENSSMLSNSVWGLRGSEDLGGGLSAIFRLENGFSINSGKTYYPGTIFGRQAYVGLQDSKYGTLTLGRQYDSVVDFLGPIALSNYGDGNNLAAHPFDNDNVDDSFYINNAVKYETPTIAGLQFESLYAFSNAAGGFSNDRVYSFGLSYSTGPVNLAAAYMQINNGAGGFLDNKTTGALSSNDSPSFPAQNQRVMGAGGNYTFGKATVGALWTHTLFANASSTYDSGMATPASLMFNDLHFDNFEVNAHYQLTPAISFAGAYTFTQAAYSGPAGSADPKWHQVTLMADYSFSKRTDVYAEGVYQHSYGAAAGMPLSSAYINGLTPSSTNNQVAATVGIRTRF